MNSFSISDDEFGKPSKIFFLDTNLNSPVLITEIEETRTLIDHYTNRHITQENTQLSRGKSQEIKYFSKVVKEMKIENCDLVQSKFLTPEIYPDVLKSMKIGLNPKNIDYDLASQVALQLEDAICLGLESRGLPVNEVKGTASALGLSHNLEYRLIYSRISDLFGKAESRVKNHEFNWTYASIGLIKIAFNSKSGFLIQDNQIYYSSLNQILMLKDLIASRFMMLEHVTALGLSENLIHYLNQLFEWQDDTLKTYGNYAYNLLKTTEPLFKTRLSHLDDNIFGLDTAYSRMVEKVKSKELSMVSLSGESSDQTSKLTRIVESISDIRCLVELFGCMKSCGHPLIDPALGGLSAAQEARSPDKTSLVDAQRLRNTFCHTILVAYVKQKGVWPKLIHLKPNTKLRQMNDRQERQIGYASYDLEDWNHTEWTKILDFDYFPNFLELMDDKAISLYRRDKHLTWDKSVKPTSQRRLLLEVMQRSNINIKDIVDQVSRRDIPEDWKIVSLYPKEREFKIEPRMFSMLVLEMRCFFTCIEANLADKLFRYLPQQTMTKTKTQNQERFLAFTDPNKDSHNSTLFIEIDLTRWNLRWRELVIHMLGHDINQMFGMKGTFTVTHWFFQQCQIIVRVQNCRPPGVEQKTPPDSDLAWTNHLGGFEGLNQKLWTAATYAMVEMGLIPLIQDNTISSYELIGQGDNQVVRLSVPCSKSERASILPLVRDKVNQALEKACKSVNQIVKPEENIESTSVLTYSKDVFVRGVEYSTSLKKHSRLFPVTSLDFPSVTANVRSILAGAVAGGENSLHPLRSAIIGIYHSARYLSAASRGMCIHGQSFPKLTMNHIISALLIPSSLGGLCGLNLASFFYKGGSDPLGKEISGLKLLSSGSNFAAQICSRALRALEEKYGIAETFDLKSLIDNPYGIPLSRKISPLSQVGDLTLDAFKYNVKNEDISPLIQSEIKESEITLKEDLISIRPLNPLLAHDLFESSGFGTIKLMRKMFVHTRTVQSVAQWVNPNITHTFLRSDLNEVLVFLKWLKGIPNTPYSGRSSYQLTKLFRSYWGLELHGVCSHQPLDFMHNKSSNRSLSSIKWSAHSATNLLHTRGPLTGYLGTTTREKRSEHGFKLVDTGAPSRSIMKLQLIKSQAYGNKQFNDLLQNISYTRSCVSLNSLTDLLPKVIGGSISHRYSSVMRQMSASYVGPLNFVTHIRIDTDNLGEVSGSVFNYPIMIQEFIVVAQYGAKLLHLHEQVQHGELIFDPVQLETLPEDSLACNDTKFTHSKLPKTPLLFSEELYVMRTYDSVANEIPSSAIVIPVDYETIQCIHDAVFGFFVSTLRDQNRAKQLADTRGYANIPAKYQIDVPEAHAIGGKIILQQAAQAIVYTTFRDTFRTVQLHPQRWDEALFMSHSIDACLKSVIRYWLHPLFKSHKDYRSFEGATLRYGFTGSLLSRLAAYVRRQIYVITHDVSDNFWTRPIPTFAGENKTQFSECLMTLGARAVLRYKITDHPYYTGLANDFVSYMMLPKSMSLESGEVLDLIRCRYTIFAETIRKRSDEMLALEMLKIKDFKLTRVYADDIVTVMRNARSKTPLLRKKISPSLRKALSDKVMIGDHCKHCLPEAEEYVDKQWTRYCQRKNGGIVSSGYTWLVLAPLMSVTRNVAIVGNGNGGLADLLITLFNVDVLGLDLCSDMPKDQTTLMDYSPLGIQDENLSKFLQSDLSMVTSGDWFDVSVRHRFYLEFNGLTTLFIDIVNADPPQLAQTMLESLDQGNVSSVYCRIAGNQSDILAFGEMFYPLMQVKMWVLSRGEDDLECIFFLTRSKISTHACTSALPLCSINIPEEYHSLIPRKYGLLLEAATCNSISWDKNTLDESKEQMENLCQSLLNKPESIRLKYHDRMNLILGYSTIVAAVEPDPLLVIKVWKQTGSIQTNLFKYKAKQSDINHIVKYAARLSNSIFDSYYFIS